MSIAISVRRATATDAPALAELVNRAYALEQRFVDGPRTTTAEIAALTRDELFLVLEHDGGLAAAVLVRPISRDGRAGAYIGMLSVQPELQGSGLGTRLVRIAEAMGEAMGARFCELRIVNLREELARWYRGLGYREVGTQPYTEPARLKEPAHFVDMRRELVPAPATYVTGAAAFA